MARIDFGYILRRLRHSRDETLEQVSEATGLSVAMLSRIERGERLPSPESVEVLARHFGLSADYLKSETIAHRLVNRYGEESASRTAEHMTREREDLALMADTAEDVEKPRDRLPGPQPDTSDSDLRGTVGLTADRPARAYGPFQQRDILEVLGENAPAQRELKASRSAPVSTGMDSATERVLRAAAEASEAAAVLVRREAPSLSREARLALIDRVSALAGQATEILQMLALDPDPLVRDTAREALRRLARS